MRRDKKRLDGVLKFALPIALGSVKVGVEVSEAEIEPVLRACMAPPPAEEMSA